MMEIIDRGGPVMIPLLFCSLVSLTVIIERTIFWLTVDIHRSEALAEEVLELCEKGDWEAVRNKTSGTRNRIVKMLVIGILHREYSLAQAMESAATEEVKNMRRYMGVLDTIITVAPLLGIFGTVLGIIHSFDMLGAGGIEQPQEVTAGIAQALITTAAGLGIAILTVFPYNIFNSKIDNAVLSLESYATRLEIILKKNAGDMGKEGRGSDETQLAGAA